MIDVETFGFSWVCVPEPEGDPCTPVFQHCDDCDGNDENCEACGGHGGGFCCHHDLLVAAPVDSVEEGKL